VVADGVVRGGVKLHLEFFVVWRQVERRACRAVGNKLDLNDRLSADWARILCQLF